MFILFLFFSFSFLINTSNVIASSIDENYQRVIVRTWYSKPYIEVDYKISLMSELKDEHLLEKNVYVEQIGKDLKYRVFNFHNQMIIDGIIDPQTIGIHIDSDLTSEDLENWKIQIFYEIEKRGHIQTQIAPESVGHISLEIPSQGSYLSFWPDDCCLVRNPSEQPLDPIFVRTYYEDVVRMGKSADSIVCLYKLNVINLSDEIRKIKINTKKWQLASCVELSKNESEISHNCSTAVFSALLGEMFKDEEYISEEYIGDIFFVYDSLLPVEHRLKSLSKLSTKWIITKEYGVAYNSWIKLIKEEKVLYPYPKVTLTKIPYLVTPCSVDLWVKNLRDREREDFKVSLIPSYKESIKTIFGISLTNQEDLHFSWISSPLESIKRTFSFQNSYLSEHAIISLGSYFLWGYFVNKNYDHSADITKCFFWGTMAHGLYKALSGRMYLYQPVYYYKR